ncbi:hypothetical protein WA026_023345 [Henosepilachna vigintioctopunctata]|uniref:Uncharacterized protein n=1 Tax=Henosepilachna vigintioctopunctata TaxID=420089 RepID=A0AAW1VCC4_9CUCU
MNDVCFRPIPLVGSSKQFESHKINGLTDELDNKQMAECGNRKSQLTPMLNPGFPNTGSDKNGTFNSYQKKRTSGGSSPVNSPVTPKQHWNFKTEIRPASEIQYDTVDHLPEYD